MALGHVNLGDNTSSPSHGGGQDAATITAIDMRKFGYVLVVYAML
jgi:hypothetical protein